jgi:DNA-binding response OmpR family regulator
MKARVLIIEDIREMAELIGLYLGKEGIETEIVESAEAGFELLKVGDFDLVVLDINLPGMDGFEFLQRLRTTNRLPVIIVSAREADEDIVMGLGAGADEFVVKPFSPKV